ncbi:MAG TPA: hypothetical protein VFT22_37860 [Kofleriaceae bacterium]|nr:hypothetical protein [Kofleriaceae bacterium]
MRRVAAFVVLAGVWAVRAGLSPAVAAPAVELSVARSLLPAAEACDGVECLIERAYRTDRKAGELALALWAESGDLAGVGPDEVMDGGYRGRIHLVPQLPVGGYRRHLAWVAGATRAIDAFFTELFTGQGAPSYRWRGLAFRFVRSVGKRTPSAYATGWAIEYNVEGSLHTSAAGVLETVFHELFHSNDEDHGDWSARHLQADYDAILARCGSRPKVSCLAPYAPNDTMVRGGTYYAFQQNNGDAVHEYAAELAVRYFKEQREMLADGKLSRRAFKCGPAVNARAWTALVDEFFGGRDLVPTCDR